jgi:hypothetical protein
MRRAVLVVAGVIWTLAWLVVPTSWWVQAHVLDADAFEATVEHALQVEDVDTDITNRITAEAVEATKQFVAQTFPQFAGHATAMFDLAGTTIAGLVNAGVNSPTGERVLVSMAAGMHEVFVAWVDEAPVGRPGLQADFDEGRVELDVDEFVAGEDFSVGPFDVAFDNLDLPVLSVPIALPPEWMRAPVQVARDALLPALLGVTLSGALLVGLGRGSLRAVAAASLSAAAACAVALGVIAVSWRASSASDWAITRELTTLLVRPWVVAYVWVIAGMLLVAVAGWAWDRRRMVVRRAPA